MTQGIYDLRTGSQVNSDDSLKAEYDQAIAEFDNYLSTK